jgi:hypothetical protein
MGQQPSERRVVQRDVVEPMEPRDRERLRRRAAVLRERARARTMVRAGDTLSLARMLVARRQYRH